MTSRPVRGTTLAALAIGGLTAGLLGTYVHASAAPPTYTITNVGTYGGEPSITSDSNGILYDTTPSTTDIYRSANKGQTWTQIQSADNNSGDDCLATDETNALYWCNLASTTKGTFPLQADVWKTTVPTTCNNTGVSCNWVHGDGAISNTCSTSCSPSGVDRQWTAASLLTTSSTNTAEVVIMYHDFYGPSSIWFNKSTDGGATFGTATNIFAGAASTSIPNAVTAEGYTFCNTVPSGIGIVKQKLPNGNPNPHAGRIYLSWIASDPAQDIGGCNISMGQSFHTLWVAWSDDNGNTWSFQQAIDVGVGHDASTPFASFTLDDQGNPYIAFDAMDVASSTNEASCAAESATNAEQTDATCNYKTYVVWCSCGGSSVSFGDGAGTLAGSASAPYLVNPNVTGTSVFATIAAGDPGKVDVSWLQTPTVVPTDPLGKFDPGGCAGNITGNPPNYPQTACSWNLWAGQSLNLTGPVTGTGAATWTVSMLTSAPMHVGDVCNLGIACGPTSNRNLLDFNQETVDPTTGCVHIGYADDNAVNLLRAANQVSGPPIIGTGDCASIAQTPEVPWAPLLLPAGAAAAIAGLVVRRRHLTRTDIG